MQNMVGLLYESLKIPDRSDICRLNQHPIPRSQPVKLLFKLQQGERTLQAAGIKFNGGGHDNFGGTCEDICGRTIYKPSVFSYPMDSK